MFCVSLSMDLFVLCVACLTVFVNCLVKQFVIFFWVWLIFCYGVVGWMCPVGWTMHGLPKRVCVVFVFHVCV